MLWAYPQNFVTDKHTNTHTLRLLYIDHGLEQNIYVWGVLKKNHLTQVTLRVTFFHYLFDFLCGLSALQMYLDIISYV